MQKDNFLSSLIFTADPISDDQLALHGFSHLVASTLPKNRAVEVALNHLGNHRNPLAVFENKNVLTLP